MKKPFTAVTAIIERLTSEEYEENDVGGIPDLIEAIKIQDTGPSEASRAIRKKLKYGHRARQLRALTILDALIGNAGPRFQRCFADEPLLERLRLAATDPATDADVKAKLKVLFAQWAREYKQTQGLSSIANLYKQFPRQRQRPMPNPLDSSSTSSGPASPTSVKSPPIAPTPTSPPVSAQPKPPVADRSHKKSSSTSRSKSKPFNLQKELPTLKETLANASIASTNLTNSLRRINREKERSSDNAECRSHQDICKTYRKSILRYIQLVESEQWIGSLLHANDELITALQLYENYNKTMEQDSDSEEEWNIVPTPSSSSDTSAALSGLRLGSDGAAPPPMPPRPGGAGIVIDKGKATAAAEPEEEEEEEDPDDPFGNQYQIVDTDPTPREERPGMTWKVV